MKLSSTYTRTARRIGALAFSGLTLAVLAACQGGHAQGAGVPAAAQVSAAVVELQKINQWDEFSGRIEAVESVQLRPRVSGYIDTVHYREGQDVAKGDVLFTIDRRQYQAEYDRANAELARARSQAALTRDEASRAQRLAAQQAIAVELAQQRSAAAEQASAQVRAAQAALDAARLKLEFTQVRAPIAGRAGRALVTAGNLVSAGDAASVLTSVVALDTVHVHFDADEASYLRYLQLARNADAPQGQRLPVQVGLSGEDGHPHRGWVDFTDNQVSRSTGTIAMRAVLDNTDRQFVPGLFARVSLLGSAGVQALLVDERAVLTDQDRKFVYVVDKAGTAQRRDIQLAGSALGLRVVAQGLVPGERVIVDGVQKIFMPGMPVDATAVAMQPAAATPPR